VPKPRNQLARIAGTENSPERAARKSPPSAPAADGRVRRLRQELALYRFVRDGLARLGIDSDSARMLARNEARAHAALDALPPGAHAGAFLNDIDVKRGFGSPRTKARFESPVTMFRDPATPAPDVAKESVMTLWAFIVARSSPSCTTPIGGEDRKSEDCDSGAGQ
jgi:hypothetical protein